MKTQWLKICEDLQNRLNPGTYKVWVAPLTADLEGEGKIRLSAPMDLWRRGYAIAC